MCHFQVEVMTCVALCVASSAACLRLYLTQPEAVCGTYVMSPYEDPCLGFTYTQMFLTVEKKSLTWSKNNKLNLMFKSQRLKN